MTIPPTIDVSVHHQLVFVMLRRYRLEFAARRSASWGPLPGIIGAGLIQESSLLSSCWNPRRWPLPEVIRSRLSSWTEAVITTWLAWCRVYDLRFHTTHFYDVVTAWYKLPTIDVRPHQQIVRDDTDLSPRLGGHRRGDLSQGSLELASSRNHPCYRHAGILGAGLSLRSFGHGFPLDQRWSSPPDLRVVESMIYGFVPHTSTMWLWKLPTIDVRPHQQIVRDDTDLSPRLGGHRRGDLSQGSLELASSRNHPCYRHAGILGAGLSLRSFGHGFPRVCIAFGVVTSPRNHQSSLHPGVIRSRRPPSILATNPFVLFWCFSAHPTSSREWRATTTAPNWVITPPTTVSACYLRGVVMVVATNTPPPVVVCSLSCVFAFDSLEDKDDHHSPKQDDRPRTHKSQHRLTWWWWQSIDASIHDWSPSFDRASFHTRLYPHADLSPQLGGHRRGDLSQGSLELASSRNHPCYRHAGILGAGLSLRSFGHGFPLDQRWSSPPDLRGVESMIYGFVPHTSTMWLWKLPTIDVRPHQQIVRDDTDLSPRLGGHRRGDLSQGSLELASSRNHPCYRHAGILGAGLSLGSFGHDFPRDKRRSTPPSFNASVHSWLAWWRVYNPWCGDLPRNHQSSPPPPGVIWSQRHSSNLATNPFVLFGCFSAHPTSSREWRATTTAPSWVIAPPTTVSACYPRGWSWW